MGKSRDISRVLNDAGLVGAPDLASTLDLSTKTVTLPSGSVTVAQGGTGASTLTANNVLLGNGTSAVQFVAPGTNGNVLTSNGTTWTSATPAGGGVTSLNGQTGAITDTDLNAIGSCGFLCSSTQVSGSFATPGSTKAGSTLRFAGILSGGLRASTTAGTGTWRCMGNAFADEGGQPVTLYVRIS